MARTRQQGLTLIEVMVALVVVSSGLLVAAGLQWRALQGTDSARVASQAAWLAQAMLEQARSARGVDGVDQLEFQRKVKAFAGESGQGGFQQTGRRVRVSVGWSDERAGGGWRVLEVEGVQ